MRSVTIFIIKAYQVLFSPIIDAIFGGGNTCRYSPTCSEYMIEAVKKYGVLKGVGMGIKRIGRCNPYAKGGIDPIK